MTKTENTTTGMRAVLGGVFAAFGAGPSAAGKIAKPRAARLGYLPAR